MAEVQRPSRGHRSLGRWQKILFEGEAGLRGYRLHEIDLEIPDKAITAFIGPSGCGKSTFLRSINRMNETIPGVKYEGDIVLHGEDIYQRGMDVEELRTRLTAPPGSTEVTVPGGATLHNAWRAVPARTLFEQYDRAEKLLNQLGSGLNIELAVQAMLSALVVNRGRA